MDRERTGVGNNTNKFQSFNYIISLEKCSYTLRESTDTPVLCTVILMYQLALPGRDVALGKGPPSHKLAVDTGVTLTLRLYRLTN